MSEDEDFRVKVKVPFSRSYDVSNELKYIPDNKDENNNQNSDNFSEESSETEKGATVIRLNQNHENKPNENNEKNNEISDKESEKDETNDNSESEYYYSQDENSYSEDETNSQYSYSGDVSDSTYDEEDDNSNIRNRNSNALNYIKNQTSTENHYMQPMQINGFVPSGYYQQQMPQQMYQMNMMQPQFLTHGGINNPQLYYSQVNNSRHQQNVIPNNMGSPTPNNNYIYRQQMHIPTQKQVNEEESNITSITSAAVSAAIKAVLPISTNQQMNPKLSQAAQSPIIEHYDQREEMYNSNDINVQQSTQKLDNSLNPNDKNDELLMKFAQKINYPLKDVEKKDFDQTYDRYEENTEKERKLTPAEIIERFKNKKKMVSNSNNETSDQIMDKKRADAMNKEHPFLATNEESVPKEDFLTRRTPKYSEQNDQYNEMSNSYKKLEELPKNDYQRNNNNNDPLSTTAKKGDKELIESLNLKINSLREDLSDKMQQIHILQNKLKDASLTGDDSYAKLKAKEKELEAKNIDFLNTKSKLEDAVNKNNDLQITIKEIRKSAEGEIKSLSEKCNTLEREKNLYIKQCSDKDREIQRLNGILGKYEDQIREMKDRMKNMNNIPTVTQKDYYHQPVAQSIPENINPNVGYQTYQHQIPNYNPYNTQNNMYGRENEVYYQQQNKNQYQETGNKPIIYTPTKSQISLGNDYTPIHRENPEILSKKTNGIIDNINNMASAAATNYIDKNKQLSSNPRQSNIAFSYGVEKTNNNFTNNSSVEDRKVTINNEITQHPQTQMKSSFSRAQYKVEEELEKENNTQKCNDNENNKNNIQQGPKLMSFEEFLAKRNQAIISEQMEKYRREKEAKLAEQDRKMDERLEELRKMQENLGKHILENDDLNDSYQNESKLSQSEQRALDIERIKQSKYQERQQLIENQAKKRTSAPFAENDYGSDIFKQVERDNRRIGGTNTSFKAIKSLNEITYGSKTEEDQMDPNNFYVKNSGTKPIATEADLNDPRMKLYRTIENDYIVLTKQLKDNKDELNQLESKSGRSTHKEMLRKKYLEESIDKLEANCSKLRLRLKEFGYD